MRAQDRRTIRAAKRQAATKAALSKLPFTATPNDLPADFGRVPDAPVNPDFTELVGAAAEHVRDHFRLMRVGEHLEEWSRQRTIAIGRAAIAAVRQFGVPPAMDARLWSTDGEADDAPYRGRD